MNYTEEDLKASFENGKDCEYSGGYHIYSFESFMNYRFCIDRNGHEWIDNPKDLGMFYCQKCGVNKK